ncbi:enoyl-CoA hydratase/isomerase family protein [Pseudalkalibacillus hwajinpoensis]|uniref:enoyl-CoA hydratase/isomerase family protein n=1 Tax=Guptibacillus hwajinpoensis TaxID=208199 RepID=UPI001CD7C262|nr:enoyl-CoA hydratase/isomerase family protein [Pseudalkalibacillus hwajinpoensis]MCA0990119.1 enoyl-CoA hydratase/isomerase family protein [Pseudalkalibacillus hwajinpoensis]
MTSVITTQRNQAAIITIHRPEQRNAINFEVMDQLSQAIETVEADDRISYIVLTGSGDKVFCSGGDVRAFQELRTEDQAYPMLRKMGNVLDQLFFCKKPTVALLNGHAVGGGLELAMACDYRIARKNTKVGFIQGSIGLTTGWGGSTYALTRMNHAEALKMLMSADRYSSEEAFLSGCLTYITDDLLWEEDAYRYIENLLKRSPLILSSYKTYWLNSLDSHLIRHRVEEEIRSCARLWDTEEHHQAVKAFLNKNS